MILKEFSKYLQANKDKNSVKLLNKWLIEHLQKPSLEKVDIILQTELYFAKNNNNKTLIIGKRDSGRTLLNALHLFQAQFRREYCQQST